MFFFSVCSEGGRKRKRGGGEDRPGKGWEEGDWQDSEVVSPVQGRETTEKLISALPPQFATLLLTLRRPLPSMPCPLQRTPPSPPPSSASGESRHEVWMSRELRATGGAWITLCTHGEINQPQNELKTRIFYTVNFPVEEDVCPITASLTVLHFSWAWKSGAFVPSKSWGYEPRDDEWGADPTVKLHAHWLRLKGC